MKSKKGSKRQVKPKSTNKKGVKVMPPKPLSAYQIFLHEVVPLIKEKEKIAHREA
jgi:hypothetical protein